MGGALASPQQKVERERQNDRNDDAREAAVSSEMNWHARELCSLHTFEQVAGSCFCER
jgi:hypothetical protein